MDNERGTVQLQSGRESEAALAAGKREREVPEHSTRIITR